MPLLESDAIPEPVQAESPLNCEERIRLNQLENVIQGSLEKFLLTGRALLEIKTRRLYRQDYATFEDYCTKRWGLSGQRGRELASSTIVAETLLAGPASPNGDSPLPADLSDHTLRPLAKLPPPLQVECWRLVSRLTQKPTHSVVARIVRVVTGAIDQGCGNGQKPERVESDEVTFLRPVFRLARLPFPEVEFFAAHFGEDQEQAARAIAACREVSGRCQSICAVLVRRFPGLECNQSKERIGPRA